MTCLRYLYSLFAIILTVGHGEAQTLPAQWVTDHEPETTLPDSLEIESLSDTCLSILKQLHGQAYLEASLDSVKRSSTEIQLFLHLGSKYRWSYLDLSAIPAQLQDQIKVSIGENELYSHEEIQALFERLLTKAENTGYPFMAIRLDSIGIKDGNIRAKVAVNTNERISIERVRVEGDLKLSSRFLTHLIDVEEGDLFSRDKIIKARDRLTSVPFIKANKDPSIDFLGDGATVNLFLDKKNANRFDILLGLLPTNDNETQKFRITGNVDIDMANQFGAGEQFHMNYENLSPGTQNLSLALNYPFIFGWTFGADLQFDLYKRDSSYIDLGYEAGIQYFLRQDNYLQFFIENQRTNILTVDTNRVKQTRSLDQFLDITQNLFGVGYHAEKLDYRFNPRRGVALTLKARAGTKKIKKNNTIIGLRDQNDPEFSYDDLYKDLDLNSFQYKLNSTLEFYIPLFKTSALKLANTSGWVGSGQALYNNELYRIGGARLLRGFNEQSIFASFYAIFTAEYRLLFNQNSNIFVFADSGFYNQNTNLNKSSDTPFGVGTGLNLETKVGIFAISYAIGREKNNPFSFRNGRIHFGMVSQF